MLVRDGPTRLHARLDAPNALLRQSCRLDRLPIAVQQLIFDYFAHNDVITLAVCALESTDQCPVPFESLSELWSKPIQPVALAHKAAACACWAAVVAARLRLPKRLKAELYPPWVMYEAVRRGDPLAVEQLHPHTRYEPHVAMEIAGSTGNLELVEWLYHRSKTAKSPRSSPATTIVIDLLAGRDETILFGFEYVNWTVHVRSSKKSSCQRFCASRSGMLPNIPILAALVKQPYPLFAYAVSTGDRELVEQLLKCESSLLTLKSFEYTLALAAGNGKSNVVRWLLSKRKSSVDEIPQAMVSAAQHGHLEVLTYLHESILSIGPDLVINLREQEQLRIAALYGHLHIVQYLVLRLRVEITAQVFDNAARQGHMAVVVWLANRGTNDMVLPSTISRAAVSGGNVELVRWLVVDRGCPLYREALCHAAEENRLGVLQWLHEYACIQAEKDGRDTPQHIFDYESISLAALRCQGSIDCATWLIKAVPWADPLYSARDLRTLDKWYEVTLRRELGIEYRNDPLILDQHIVSERPSLSDAVSIASYRRCFIIGPKLLLPSSGSHDGQCGRGPSRR